MIIRKLEIFKALGFEHLKQRYNSHGVFVVQGHEECLVRTSLCTAVQLLCDPKYANRQSLIHLRTTQQSYIAMVFFINSDTIAPDEDESEEDDDKPSTSAQAAERSRRRRLREEARKRKVRRIWVRRDFHSVCETFSYKIDSANIVHCRPRQFHKLLGFTEHNVNRLGEKASNLFGRFTKLYMTQKYENNHILMQLSKSALIGSDAIRVIQGDLVLKVFQDTRKIFEYLTFESATTVKNVDFDELSAFVQRVGHEACDWTTTSPVTQDLVRIAYKLAAAIHFKERIVYLENLQNIKKEQAHRYYIKMAASHFMKKEFPEENIIQRIVNTCKKHSIAAFIDYPGGMPYSVTNANVFKCRQDENGEWVVRLENP